MTRWRQAVVPSRPAAGEAAVAGSGLIESVGSSPSQACARHTGDSEDRRAHRLHGDGSHVVAGPNTRDGLTSWGS